MTPREPARVRVILVNYNSCDDVEARLASEALQDADVVVVDNASDPERVQALCDERGATAVLLGRNEGFAAGVNAGWQAVRDRPPLPLLLLNPDAVVTRASLDQLLEELAATGATGVAPLLVEPSGRPQVGVAGGPLSVLSVSAYFLFLAHVLPGLRGVFLTRRQSRSPGEVAWLCMAALLLAPDALDRFGAVPEDEVVYAEDIAWGTAATAAGARLRLVSSVTVLHPHGSSGASDQWLGAFERLLRRRLGPLSALLCVLAVRAGLAARRVLGRRISAPTG